MENIMNKSILWSLLEKYDNISGYKDFCDSISRFIQGNFNDVDITVVYKNFTLIDIEDLSKIDSTIGKDINSYLFSQ